jgi:hypothetical protein
MFRVSNIIYFSSRVDPNPVSFRPFSGRFSPKYAPGVPGFGHMNQ